MKFIDRILQPQRMLKTHLAYYYGLDPHNFRIQVLRFMWIEPRKHFLTTEEVRKIFQNMGTISEENVNDAQERIKEHYKRSARAYKVRLMRNKNIEKQQTDN